MFVVNKAMLRALKPGGILMIEDHAAASGSGARDTNSLHRIEARQVQQEVIAARLWFHAHCVADGTGLSVTSREVRARPTVC